MGQCWSIYNHTKKQKIDPYFWPDIDAPEDKTSRYGVNAKADGILWGNTEGECLSSALMYVLIYGDWGGDSIEMFSDASDEPEDYKDITQEVVASLRSVIANIKAQEAENDAWVKKNGFKY